ncbi:hypothetical protein NP233_g3282 [Leucocoprinus birnbaumii]|uniref:Nephrocystin 3-like N-terminal domain-containing protein n=1 Tax=Leucocoprinus birnbaumii TaxID=56174 RepID=A0AAD5VXC8_9AGAR|nr:hypothetical protein NP233_g3282 [Leucocoprinus birnbaumii]
MASLYNQWPPESKFLKLTQAAVGLFAYADTVIQFIGDSRAGDPVSRLEIVLALIENAYLPQLNGKAIQPMAQLDTLYRYILLQVDPDSLSRTKEILAFVLFSGGCRIGKLIEPMSTMCDWIGISPCAMHGAISQLHSVLRVPDLQEAQRRPIAIRHKSFADFLLDTTRSGLSLGSVDDENRRLVHRALRILRDVPRYESSAMSVNPSKYTTLSWSYNDIFTLLDDKHRDLYTNASLVFAEVASFADVPLPSIAHVLKVMYIGCMDTVGQRSGSLLKLMFDDASDLAKLLKADGSLRDIPARFIDLDVIRKGRPNIYVVPGIYAESLEWGPITSSAHDICWEKLFCHLEHATRSSDFTLSLPETLRDALRVGNLNFSSVQAQASLDHLVALDLGFTHQRSASQLRPREATTGYEHQGAIWPRKGPTGVPQIPHVDVPDVNTPSIQPTQIKRSESRLQAHDVEEPKAQAQDPHNLVRQASSEQSIDPLSALPAPLVTRANPSCGISPNPSASTGGGSNEARHRTGIHSQGSDVGEDFIPISEEEFFRNTPSSPTTAPQSSYIPSPSGILANAQNIVMHNPVMVETSSDEFMKEFSMQTIQGAELDSSARDPPPRCHPATRLGTIERVRSRLRNPMKRVQWLAGPAGVGKSAVMQTVAELEQEENSALITALFFSAPNGRNDPTKVITTLAYQIALQHEEYRNYLREKIKADPKLWHKSVDVHFVEFIVEPLAKCQACQDSKPIIMFIDGLDECRGKREQLRLLNLINNFTTDYPQAPFLWVIASRPEAHITGHLYHLSFYDKEEISVDSTEACQDVERFLRAEFEKISKCDPLLSSLYRQWPPEDQLLKLLAAALGLFAYAETAVRYIGDLTVGDPITRLEIILKLATHPFGSTPTSDTTTDRPMANLEMLYQYLVTQINPNSIPHVEEILAFVIFSTNVSRYVAGRSLCFMSNWIGMPANIVYSALRQLHSVLYVPSPHDADREDRQVRFYHKSFSDFLLDPIKSGISLGTLRAERHREYVRAARILKAIPYSPAKKDPISLIVLSWSPPASESLRIMLYNSASSFFRDMYTLPEIPITHVALALEVMLHLPESDTLKFSNYALGLTFSDTHAELTRILRADKALQDVSISLLNVGLVRDRNLAICPCDASTATPASWLSLYSPMKEQYAEHQRQLISLLGQAQKHSPQSLVRVFITVELMGIVQFSPSISIGGTLERQVYYFYYDFSSTDGLF